MRFLALLSLTLFATSSSSGQAAKELKFKATVKSIISAFSKLDSSAIAKFTRKDIGVYQLYRLGVFDDFQHFKRLGFSDLAGEKALLVQAKGIENLRLKYARLPTYDCEKEAWSKKGLFVDTTIVDHMLSRICRDRNKDRPDTIPNKKIMFFYHLESKSRRVVLYDNRGLELVFYLSYINVSWYLTIVDDVSSDCSA